MQSMSTWWITIDGEYAVAMKEPPHPGLSVRLDCLEALGLSVTAGAKVLGVTRQALNNLVNERAGISPEMAIRLDKAFGGTAEAWLALQAAFDLALARKKPLAVNVKRYATKGRRERLRAA
jgi:addiction module HigA family antidote